MVAFLYVGLVVLCIGLVVVLYVGLVVVLCVELVCRTGVSLYVGLVVVLYVLYRTDSSHVCSYPVHAT